MRLLIFSRMEPRHAVDSKDHLTFIEHEDAVSSIDEINRMRDKDARSILKCTKVHILDDLVGDVRIQCRDWIVHQVDVFVLVEGARKHKLSILTARHIDAVLTYQGLVAFLLHEDVAFELAVLNGVDVALRVERLVVDDVLADLLAPDPRSLGGVGDRAVDLEIPLLS